MAQDEQHLSYEQVLQELQVNRSQLNRFIREGRLTEHVMEGETKFRLAEVRDIKRNMEKSPTVMEEERAGEPATDLLEGPDEPPSKEPATELLEEEEEGEGEPAAEHETMVLDEGRPPGAAERDTEILEEEEGDLALELPDEDEASASATALETQLELERAAAAKAKESSEEDFFDFTEALEEDAIELEGPEAVEEAPAAAPEVEEEPEEEGIVTDILELGAEEEVAEEDLLSEIMDIEEEQATPGVLTAESTEDITAEITTLEEPTYEDSDLGAALEVPEEDLGPEFGAEAEFAVPYAEPIGVGESRLSGGFVVLLVLTMIVMAVALLFVVENGSRPEFSTGLTGWARTGP